SCPPTVPTHIFTLSLHDALPISNDCSGQRARKLMPKFYLTTPIYYVNARPHVGHTYTTIVADTIARYKRMRGYDVVLLTGTDEHGQKVERSAKAAGLAPQEFVDRIAAEYRHLWEELGLSVDRFVRTTELRHARAVQRLFRKAADH